MRNRAPDGCVMCGACPRVRARALGADSTARRTRATSEARRSYRRNDPRIRFNGDAEVAIAAGTWGLWSATQQHGGSPNRSARPDSARSGQPLSLRRRRSGSTASRSAGTSSTSARSRRSDASAAVSVQMGPGFFIGPFAGAVADSAPRPRILATADGLRSCTIAAMALLVHGGITRIALIFALIAVGGTGQERCSSPASQTLSGDLVGPRAPREAIQPRVDGPARGGGGRRDRRRTHHQDAQDQTFRAQDRVCLDGAGGVLVTSVRARGPPRRASLPAPRHAPQPAHGGAEIAAGPRTRADGRGRRSSGTHYYARSSHDVADRVAASDRSRSSAD